MKTTEWIASIVIKTNLTPIWVTFASTKKVLLSRIVVVILQAVPSYICDKQCFNLTPVFQSTEKFTHPVWLNTVIIIPCKVHSCKFLPRKNFKEEKYKMMAESIYYYKRWTVRNNKEALQLGTPMKNLELVRGNISWHQNINNKRVNWDFSPFAWHLNSWKKRISLMLLRT